MCECGCGAFEGEYKLPAPDGAIYVFQVNPPCPDCGTPLGLVVHRFTRREAKEWSADELPELKPTAAGIGLSLLDPERLFKPLMAIGSEVEDVADLGRAVAQAAADTRGEARKRGAW